MLLVLFLCFFAFFINFSILSYNENFLLCIFFIIFFVLVYLLMKKKFKEYNFFQIFKDFYLILLVLKLNNYLYRLLIYFFLIKKNMLKNIIIKIFLLKKDFLLLINNLFENYLVIFSLIYFLNLNKNFKLINDTFNISLLNFIDKLKFYDNILFY